MGEKTKQLFKKGNGIKSTKKLILEEHISLIEEPNTKFLSHATPNTDTEKESQNSILEFLKNHECSYWVRWNSREHWTYQWCDFFKVKCNWNFAWFEMVTYLFHGKMLPLRHPFCNLDSKTKLPNEIKGKLFSI